LVEVANVDKNIKNNDGHTVLHLAVLAHSTEIVTYLVEIAETDLNMRNNHGDTPLHIAVILSLPNIVKCLSETTRVNMKIKNNYGDTLLHYAAKSGVHDFSEYFPHIEQVLDMLDTNSKPTRCIKTMEFLVKTEMIGINTQNNNGETALHIAVASCDLEIVKYLVETAEADTTVVTNGGETALHIASRCNELDHLVVKYLRDSANTGFKQNFPGNAFNFFTANPINIMNYLVQTANIDSSILTGNGETPLHIASRYNNFEMVVCLVEVIKIDVSIENKRGETALDIAVALENQEIKEYLTKKFFR
jgi:ankyrin repeat protein